MSYANEITTDDMYIFVHSRPKSISHDVKLDMVANKLVDKFIDTNFAIVYTEQHKVISGESYTKFDILDTSPILETPLKFIQIKNFVLKLFSFIKKK